jgi:hypothetical protein
MQTAQPFPRSRAPPTAPIASADRGTKWHHGAERPLTPSFTITNTENEPWPTCATSSGAAPTTG